MSYIDKIKENNVTSSQISDVTSSTNSGKTKNGRLIEKDPDYSTELIGKQLELINVDGLDFSAEVLHEDTVPLPLGKLSKPKEILIAILNKDLRHADAAIARATVEKVEKGEYDAAIKTITEYAQSAGGTISADFRNKLSALKHIILSVATLENQHALMQDKLTELFGREHAEQLMKLIDKEMDAGVSLTDHNHYLKLSKALISDDPIIELAKLQGRSELENNKLADGIESIREAIRLAEKTHLENRELKNAQDPAWRSLIGFAMSLASVTLLLVKHIQSCMVNEVEQGVDGEDTAIDDQIDQLEEENREYENDLAGKGEGVPDPSKQGEYQSNFDNAQKQIDESGYNFDSNNMDEIEKLVEDKYLKDNFKGYDIDKETNEIIVPQYLKDEAAAEAKQIRALYEERKVAETQMKHVANQHKIAELKDQKAAHQAAREKAVESQRDIFSFVTSTLGALLTFIGASVYISWGYEGIPDYFKRKKSAAQAKQQFQDYLTTAAKRDAGPDAVPEVSKAQPDSRGGSNRAAAIDAIKATSETAKTAAAAVVSAYG